MIFQDERDGDNERLRNSQLSHFMSNGRYFSKCEVQQFFRATLASAARNRLNYWRKAARQARRLTPVISSRRRWYLFWTNMCLGVAGVGELRTPN